MSLKFTAYLFVCFFLVFIAPLCLTYFIVLHPGLKTQYFKDNKWEQGWQDEAIAIARRIFDEDYKLSGVPADLPNSSVDAQPSNTVSKPTVTNIFTETTDVFYRKIPSVPQCVSKWGAGLLRPMDNVMS